MVYLGIDQTNNDSVAVKEVLLGGLDTEKARQLARREGAVLRQLSHPGIPAWRDEVVVGVGRSATLYLVQEFIDGQNLQEGLASKRWSEREVLDLMDEVLDILHYLHTRHPPVLHRDIKPGNLIRKQDGKLVQVDFGSVRDALRSSGLGGSTVAGTFGFMAPEQFQGDAEPATDLFGLGMTAVALLTRVEPARLHNRAGQVAWEQQVAVSAATKELLRALLQPEPRARLQSAVVVKQHIQRIRRNQCGVPILGRLSDDDDLVLPPPSSTGARGSGSSPGLAEPIGPSGLLHDVDFRQAELVLHSRAPMRELAPVSTAATRTNVVRTADASRRKGPGFAKGCLFTLVLYSIFGLVGLVLLLTFAQSWPVLVGF